MTTTLVGNMWTLYPEAADPTPSRQLQLNSYLSLVDTVAAAGPTPPAPWQKRRAKLGQLQALVAGHGHPVLDRFTASVVSDAMIDDADLATLLTLARVEQSSVALEGVLTHVYANILAELHRLYGPVAASNYGVLRDRFNTAGKGFTRCAAIVDPAAPTDVIVNASEKTLRAWRDSAAYANQLEELLPAVGASAELARGIEEPCGFGATQDALWLPLTCEVGGLHRRAVWSAWFDAPEPRTGPTSGALLTEDLQPQPAPAPTRGGRWTRLLAIGAVIRAADDPRQMPLYGAPAAPGVRQVEQRTPDGNLRQVWEKFDPCDDEVAARPRALRRWLTGRRTPQADTQVDVLATIAQEADNGTD